ncbi:MAG: FAD-binding oxidoreductase [Anaerolineae bacterium]|nr:FAD-binding oxidoreductase [Anaerolineae bacterium]
MSALSPEAIQELQKRVQNVAVPGDAPFDALRTAWNLCVQQRPAFIALPSTSEEVAECVRFARQHGLGVAVQATGHGVGRPADDALLILTRNLNGVTVDATAQTAHIEAGVRWGSVLKAAQQHRLAPLLGSSMGVGAVGYTLGGGMGWLARKYGLACDHVLRFEAVNAQGEIVTASADEHADLFWALRGGGGANYALVTAMDIRLFPVTEVYGGSLLYPAEMAKAVFQQFREWAATLPDEMTASVLIMHYPDSLELPDMVRGRACAVVRGCFTGEPSEGQALIDEWRSWQTPEFDLFGAMPFMGAAAISHDPPGPLAGHSNGGFLTDLSDETIDIILAHSLPQDGPPPLVKAEVHLQGGAIARVPRDAMAVSHRDQPLLLSLIYSTPTDDTYEAAVQHSADFLTALSPHSSGAAYANFLSGEEQIARVNGLFEPEKYARLQAVKAAYDPDNVFRYGFGVPGQPAG